MIAEVVRTTGMDSNTRQRLAYMFAQQLRGYVPGFDYEKFIHEATRGTRSTDERPTLVFPSVVFTPHKFTQDWDNLDMTDEERTALRAAPMPALASSLAEAVAGQHEAVRDLEDAVHEAAVENVLRKARKLEQRAS